MRSFFFVLRLHDDPNSWNSSIKNTYNTQANCIPLWFQVSWIANSLFMPVSASKWHVNLAVKPHFILAHIRFLYGYNVVRFASGDSVTAASRNQSTYMQQSNAKRIPACVGSTLYEYQWHTICSSPSLFFLRQLYLPSGTNTTLFQWPLLSAEGFINSTPSLRNLIKIPLASTRFFPHLFVMLELFLWHQTNYCARSNMMAALIGFTKAVQFSRI